MKKCCLAIVLVLMVTALLSACADENAAPGIWQLPKNMETVEVNDPATYLLFRMEKDGEYSYTINAWENEDGHCQINYIVDQHKEATFDKAVFHNITEIVEIAGIDSYERSTVEDGDENATFHVMYKSGNQTVCDFVGQIPEDALASFDLVNDFFVELMKDVPVAETKFTVGENVDDGLVSAIKSAFKEVKRSDTLCIYNADGTEAVLSITDTDGIRTAAVCVPEMSTTPFRLEIAAVEGEPEALAAQFEKNINWGQWVCVCPDEAWIGCKDNLVMYVIGDDVTVKDLATGAESEGWTEYAALKRR